VELDSEMTRYIWALTLPGHTGSKWSRAFSKLKNRIIIIDCNNNRFLNVYFSKVSKIANFFIMLKLNFALSSYFIIKLKV